MPSKKMGKGPKLSLKQSFYLMGRLFKMMIRYYPWQMPCAALLIIVSAIAGVVGSLMILLTTFLQAIPMQKILTLLGLKHYH